MKLRLIITCVVVLFGCSKKSGPEQVLAEYIQKRLSPNADQSELLGYLTGDLKKDLSEIETGEWKKLVEKKTYAKRKFKVILSKCNGSRCYITYTLRYDRKGEVSEETSQNKIEIKNIAELLQEEEEWKIASISNVKSYYKSATPIDVTTERGTK